MANEALNLALNYVGCKCYLVKTGTTPTATNQIKGITKVSNPGGVERGVQQYIPLEDGMIKKVPTTKNVKNIVIDVAHEDETSIKLLDELVTKDGTDMYMDFYYVPTKRSDWTTGRGFYCTVAVIDSTPNDAVADGYQASSYTLAVQGQKTAYTGTIDGGSSGGGGNW